MLFPRRALSSEQVQQIVILASGADGRKRRRSSWRQIDRKKTTTGVCVWWQWHYYYYYYYYYEYYLKTKVKEPWLLALSFSKTVLWCSLFRTILCTCMYTFMSTIHPFSEPYHSCRGSEAYISWLWTSVNWNNSINQKEMWVFFHQCAKPFFICVKDQINYGCIL